MFTNNKDQSGLALLANCTNYMFCPGEADIDPIVWWCWQSAGGDGLVSCNVQCEVTKDLQEHEQSGWSCWSWPV